MSYDAVQTDRRNHLKLPSFAVGTAATCIGRRAYFIAITALQRNFELRNVFDSLFESARAVKETFLVSVTNQAPRAIVTDICLTAPNSECTNGKTV